MPFQRGASFGPRRRSRFLAILDVAKATPAVARSLRPCLGTKSTASGGPLRDIMPSSLQCDFACGPASLAPLRRSRRLDVLDVAARALVSGASNCHAALPPLRACSQPAWLLRFPLQAVPCLPARCLLLSALEYACGGQSGCDLLNTDDFTASYQAFRVSFRRSF